MAGSDVVSPAVTVGIFVGGRGRRMGGVAKGLLETNAGETILARQLETVRSASADAHVVLVGSHLAYANVQLPQLGDDPPGIGPLGGLRALMKLAQSRNEQAVALACDMPSINAQLLERLLFECPGASALAPRMDGRWQPLFARYAPLQCFAAIDAAIEQNRHSLQSVLEGAGATELRLSAEELATLDDWDHPDDVKRSHQQT